MKLLVRFSAILILFFGLGMASCKKDKVEPNVTFTATLTGANEVPPNSSTATGTATLTFNPNTKAFTVNLPHNVVGVTGGHIHKGAVGANGDVVFPFVNLTSPITFTSLALTTAQEADLNAGLYYVNLHTAAFPGGEIRGQLVKN
jgi:hypothetical protein